MVQVSQRVSMTYHHPAGNRLGLRRSHRLAVRRSHPAGLHNRPAVHRSRRVLRHRSHLLLYQHLGMRNVGLVRHTALTAESTSAASTASALGCLVDTNGATVEPESDQSCAEGLWEFGSDCAYSTLFMFAIAASASVSWAKRTKPKPRLRPVSRSLTTICAC